MPFLQLNNSLIKKIYLLVHLSTWIYYYKYYSDFLRKINVHFDYFIELK